jgi:hypothetical protein
MTRGLGQLALLLPGLFRFSRRPRTRSGRPQVVFEAYACHLAQFQEPIIRELLRDGQVDVFFAVSPHPQFPSRERGALRDWAKAVGIDRRRIAPFWKTLWWTPDLVVSADMLAAWPLRRTRTCLLSHGPAFARRAFVGRWPRRRLLDFDLVLAAGAYDRSAIETARATGSPSRTIVADVGCPLLDRLFAPGCSRAEYLQRIGLREAPPVVLYAPHWTDLNYGGEAAPSLVRAIVAALVSLPVQVILKPHVMAFLPHAALGQDWRRFFRGLVGPTVRHDEAVDDVPALAHSDVLVTGVSSRAFNFMLLGKPVVVFPLAVAPADAFEARRLELVRAAAAVARDVPSLALEVAAALHNPAARREARHRTAQILFANPGGATRATVDVLYRELGMDARMAATA